MLLQFFKFNHYTSFENRKEGVWKDLENNAVKIIKCNIRYINIHIMNWTKKKLPDEIWKKHFPQNTGEILNFWWFPGFQFSEYLFIGTSSWAFQNNFLR